MFLEKNCSKIRTVLLRILFFPWLLDVVRVTPTQSSVLVARKETDDLEQNAKSFIGLSPVLQLFLIRYRLALCGALEGSREPRSNDANYI